MDAPRLVVAHSADETLEQCARVAKQNNFKILSATHGEDGLELAARAKPDVLILDSNLSKLDSAGVIQQLRTRPGCSLIAVLFLEPREAVESRLSGFNLGADRFLPKPFEDADLAAAVRDAMEDRHRAETTVRRREMGKEEMKFSVDMEGFRGNLDLIGLASLLGMIEMDTKTGMLVVIVEPDQRKARLFFRQGKIMQASYDGQDSPVDSELIYELLEKNKGRFDFRPRAVNMDDRIGMPVSMILLEGARRLDETRHREP